MSSNGTIDHPMHQVVTPFSEPAPTAFATLVPDASTSVLDLYQPAKLSGTIAMYAPLSKKKENGLSKNSKCFKISLFCGLLVCVGAAVALLVIFTAPRQSVNNIYRSENCSCGFWDAESKKIWTHSIQIDWTKLDSFESQPFFKRADQNRGLGKNGSYVSIWKPSQVKLESGRGLIITVSPSMDGKTVLGGGVESCHSDIQYGLFKAFLNPNSVPGTVSAFYFYRDDLNEIDLEFVSQARYRNNTPTLFMGTQMGKPDQVSSWNVSPYESSPGTSPVQYGFRWNPEQLDFFKSDSNSPVHTLRSGLPVAGGSILFSHWSNGDPGWTQGPPASDAYFVISQFLAYFNSSNPTDMAEYSRSCSAPLPNLDSVVADEAYLSTLKLCLVQ